jgi:hypothetical protein
VTAKLIARAHQSAKAIVALVPPVLTLLAVDALQIVSESAEVGIASVATAVLVWLTRNAPASTPEV